MEVPRFFRGQSQSLLRAESEHLPDRGPVDAAAGVGYGLEPHSAFVQDPRGRRQPGTDAATLNARQCRLRNAGPASQFSLSEAGAATTEADIVHGIENIP